LFLPVVTLFSVLTATFFKVKDAVVNAGNFTGQCLLYVFFASAGASSPGRACSRNHFRTHHL
jgi:hypothetical protein